jgi:serine/threonine-protein kinase
VLWLVAAPVTLALAAGAFLAYRALNERPEVTVPSLVGTDGFYASLAVKGAGLEMRTVERQDARPGGTVLAVKPSPGHTVHEGDTILVVTSANWAEVPDVVGRPESVATGALRAVGLVNIVLTDDFTDRVAPGTVTSTQPLAHLHALKTDSVTVSVARDPTVVIPTVIGLDEGSARAALEARGLTVASQSESNRTKPAGTVLSVRPGEGATATRGDTVVLRVSSGPAPVDVHDYTGRSQSDAARSLTRDGFNVNVVTVAVKSSSQVGRVVAQNPVGGQLPEGSVVTLTVGTR